MRSLDSNTFEEIIYDEGEACLVMFSRKSCHVCQAVKPVLEELLPEYEGKFEMYHVDIEEQRDLFQRFSLKGVPQLLFFKDGEYQGKMAGQVAEEQVEEKIAEVLGI